MAQLAIKSYKTFILYVISGLFLLLNCFLIAHEVYWFLLFPIAMLIIWLAIFHLDLLLLLTAFLVPLSVNLKDISFGVGMNMPTEPIMFGVLVLFTIRLFADRGLPRELLRHPVSVAILINLFWLFITTLTSQMPVVSAKFLISRLWFVVGFFFFGVRIFRDMRYARSFMWLYIFSLIFVILFALGQHVQFNFDEQSAHWVMHPFYNDHTAYGAALAMYFPFIVSACFDKTIPPDRKLLVIFVGVLFTVAIILSYTRATWVSLVGVFGLYLLFRAGVKLKHLAMVGVAALILFFTYQDEIFLKLEGNRQDSSTQLSEHVQSISNISTDASNLERINRWKSAFRMFREKPFVGWGPGTYAFQYAPYQRSAELTIISTNAGDMGNAHSEYIGPMVESGVFGLISFLLVIITICHTFSKIMVKGRHTREVRHMAIVIFLGLTTYLIHGFLNNFLDTDKASVPFWGFAAILVALDIYGKRKNAGGLNEPAAEKSHIIQK